MTVKSKVKPSILFVDDDGSVREILYAALGRKYDTAGFPSGLDLLEYMETATPNLIVLDVCMPVIDGYSVCRAIRSKKAFRDIPILFLTALHDDRSFLQGFNVGASAFMTKPFEMAELKEKIEDLLRAAAR